LWKFDWNVGMVEMNIRDEMEGVERIEMSKEYRVREEG